MNICQMKRDSSKRVRPHEEKDHSFQPTSGKTGTVVDVWVFSVRSRKPIPFHEPCSSFSAPEMLQSIVRYIFPSSTEDNSSTPQAATTAALLKKCAGKKITITPQLLSSLNSQVIRSSMYLSFYNPERKLTCFTLPTHERLFFISSSTLIHQLTSLESQETNPFTRRVQSYQYNQLLLTSNPVSTSSLTKKNYAHSQHQLFVKLSQEINLNHLTFPESVDGKKSVIEDNELVRFVINLTAQIYLPMLLNVNASHIPLILDDFVELLNLLEIATGKHGVTFQDYLTHKTIEYSDLMEQQYIRLFYRIVSTLTSQDSGVDVSEKIFRSKDLCLEDLCSEILTTLSSSNLVAVLSTVMDPVTDARVMVNNLLSWIDNMLNVVHTIVNLLILITQQNHGEYSQEFYQRSLCHARALATMFMRHVVEPFQIVKDNGYPLQLREGDILMMSNGNADTTFGGKGRKCPSQPWSYLFMRRMLELITTRYRITYSPPSSTIPEPISFSGSISCVPTTRRAKAVVRMPPQDSENNSWFWNKFSTQGVRLIPIEQTTLDVGTTVCDKLSVQ
jgi:hypothetical protein